MDTGSRKWGHPYLNRAFFSLLGAAHAATLPARDGQGAAAATSPARCISSAAIASTAATGAPIEHHPFLHFELCYYQAIDFAIAHGLARAEAGAQGEHKLARGYLPSRPTRCTGSPIPALRRPSQRYLEARAREVAEISELTAEHWALSGKARSRRD